MILAALSLSVALAAPPALPYPAPRGVTATEKTRCDTGAVLAASAEKGTLQISTPAGVVTYRTGPELPVFDREGKAAGPWSRLSPGQKVRVYYLVEDGARALEVDLEG